MKRNMSRQFLWIMQVVGVCVAAPKVLATDDPCPCRPLNDCPDSSQLLFEKDRATETPCESEHLTRCCSIIPNQVESSSDSEYLRSIDQDGSMGPDETATKAESTEKLTQFEQAEISGSTDENLEYSTIESEITQSPTELSFDAPSQSTQFLEDLNKMNMDATENENVDHSSFTESYMEKIDTKGVQTVMTFTNANQELSLQHVPTSHQQSQYMKRRPIPESRQIRVRILNQTPARPIAFLNPQKVKSNNDVQDDAHEPKVKKSDRTYMTEISMVHDTEDQPHVQHLIDEVTKFESFRISPKKRGPFLIRDSVINFLPSGRPIETTDYHPDSTKFSSSVQSVSEKMSNFFKQKTSLGTPFTLDRASSGATNENAKPMSKLDTLPHDDTSIRNLSHPEAVENIKRVARSHISDIADKSRKDIDSPIKNINSSGSTDNTNAEDRVEGANENNSVRRFKRPPRILPVKHLRSGEDTSNKFGSSRERARSLFNMSNEMRRKLISFHIKNRNDSN